ncbi:alpha/beta-hydrolase [Calocera viscosa TUFC12733]|uniref:Alpha/beta-hydrolase n=1 Tax=Calocera viscosa (strain TUFC12733) TaxID=1330018 RepID=A0A167QTG3_CALVF|nr:alpha/beta-hydrolase [Calocera viscosa TUFC12733]
MAAPGDPAPAAAPGIPVPFKISFPDADVGRLRRKLADTVLPEEIVPDAGWEYGLSLSTLRELKSAWESFDWRSAEEGLNAYEHYTVSIEGLTLHYVHCRSPRQDAIPLLMIHGYPSCFAEFLPLLPTLTEPPEGKQAFSVVLPSVPGFGLSSAPPRGWTVKDTARVLDTLMTGVLGYTAYAAQGGDWGYLIASQLAAHPSCLAVHATLCVAPPPLPIPFYIPLYLLPSFLSGPLINWCFTPPERAAFARTWQFLKRAGGIFPLAATQPALIGYALSDSPLGLLAWVGEKHTTPLLTDPERPIPVDKILTTLSLYFFTRCIPTAHLQYHENASSFAEPPARISRSRCTLGVSQFAHDVFAVPERWVRRYHTGCKWFRRHEHGGHFPAMDSPEELVQDLRDFLGENKTLFAGSR